MSDLRQAAQQALEALELAQTDVHWELHSPTRKCLRKAEKALRAALDTPDSANRSTDSAEPFCIQKPVAEIVQAFADLKAVSFCGEMPPVGAKLYTELTPQPEQPHDLLCLCGAEWHIYSDGREELVAAPQSRTPLTDEEIQTIWAKTFEMGSSANTFARAIERAHGIKEQEP